MLTSENSITPQSHVVLISLQDVLSLNKFLTINVLSAWSSNICIISTDHQLLYMPSPCPQATGQLYSTQKENIESYNQLELLRCKPFKRSETVSKSFELKGKELNSEILCLQCSSQSDILRAKLEVVQTHILFVQSSQSTFM